jgi:hypothetical protein
MYIDLMSSTLYSCQVLIKLEFSLQGFENSSKMKFNKNPSSGNPVIHCGLTYGQTDMTKMIVAFRNLANSPKRSKIYNRKTTNTKTDLQMPKFELENEAILNFYVEKQ